MAQKKDTEFLTAYLKKSQYLYKAFTCYLDESDFQQSSDDGSVIDTDDERAARLADDYGFDGSLCRDLLVTDDDPRLLFSRKSIPMMRLKKRIETIPKIIHAIEKPPDNSIIPDDAELLTVPQVARLLGWGESVVRERDKKGLLPLPVRIGGTIQWRRKEIVEWIAAGCPPRAKWLQTQGKAVA